MFREVQAILTLYKMVKSSSHWVQPTGMTLSAFHHPKRHTDALVALSNPSRRQFAQLRVRPDFVLHSFCGLDAVSTLRATRKGRRDTSKFKSP
jgi:hypothetical protein